MGPATTATCQEPRRSVRASNANTSAMPNSPRIMYQGVNEIMRQALYCHQWILRAIFFVEWNVYRAEEPDDDQTELAEMLPQSQADVSELHRHDFPRKRHPHWRAPDHQAATDPVIQCVRVI